MQSRSWPLPRPAARVEKLSGLSETLTNVGFDLEVWTLKLQILGRLDEINGTIQKIEESCSRLILLGMKEEQLKSWQRDVNATAAYLQRLKIKESAAKEEYQNLLIESGTCPLCGADTTQFKLKEVV